MDGRQSSQQQYQFGSNKDTFIWFDADIKRLRKRDQIVSFFSRRANRMASNVDAMNGPKWDGRTEYNKLGNSACDR